MNDQISVLRREGSANWDRVGVFLSSACMLHCLAFPLLMLLMPMSLKFMDDDHFHAFVFWPVFTVAVIAFVRSYVLSHRWLPLALGLLGLVCLVSSRFLLKYLSQGEWAEHLLTLISSIFLVCSHVMNLKTSGHLRRQADSARGAHAEECKACQHI